MDVNDLGNIDGVDVWQALISNKTSPRSEVLINIDDIDNYASIRRGDFKYVIGHTDTGDEWYGEPGRLDHKETGSLERYVYPEKVLTSKAAIAISGVITTQQVMDLRKRRESKFLQIEDMKFSTKMLTADDVAKLRAAAIIRCNIQQEQQVTD